MTPLQLAVAGDELVAAWLAWDAACARLSVLADDALAAGKRPPRPNGQTLEPEARRLADACRVLRVPLDFGRVVAEHRVSGLSVADAVQAAVNDLTTAIR